jgi:ribosomal protein L12E/L44/L45/RPP1/RPP2
VLLGALKSIQPGQRFAHSWIEPFRLDRAVQGYENLIDEVLSAGTSGFAAAASAPAIARVSDKSSR